MDSGGRKERVGVRHCQGKRMEILCGFQKRHRKKLSDHYCAVHTLQVVESESASLLGIGHQPVV